MFAERRFLQLTIFAAKKFRRSWLVRRPSKVNTWIILNVFVTPTRQYSTTLSQPSICILVRKLTASWYQLCPRFLYFHHFRDIPRGTGCQYLYTLPQCWLQQNKVYWEQYFRACTLKHSVRFRNHCIYFNCCLRSRFGSKILRGGQCSIRCHQGSEEEEWRNSWHGRVYFS